MNNKNETTGPADPSAVFDLVAPHRRAEVMRRIALLERYWRSPSRQAAEAGAAEIGVHVATFYSLARAWRDTRRPELLSGSGRPRKRRDQLATDQRQVITDAIAEQTGERLERIFERARAIAAERGVPLPQEAALRSHIRHAMPVGLQPGSFASGADLVIEHCAVDVPVAGDDGGAHMPVATIVATTVEPRVLGVALARTAPSAAATAKAMAVALARLTGGKDFSVDRPLSIALDVFPGNDWGELVKLLHVPGIHVVGRRRKALAQAQQATALLGTSRAGVRLRPRLGHTPFDRRTATLPAGAAPMSLSEAETFLAARWHEDPPIDTPDAPSSDTARQLVEALNEAHRRWTCTS